MAFAYPPPVLRCTAFAILGLILTTFATTLSDVVQSFHRIKTIAAVNLVSGLALTGASILAARLNPAPDLMAAAYLTGPAISAALLYGVVRRHICPVRLHVSRARFLALLSHSRFFAAQQLLFAGSNHAESLLSPRLIGMEPFGNFAAGATLGNRLVTLPDALCAAAYPAMVQACRRDRRAGAAVILRYFLIALLGGIAVAIAGMIVAAPLGRLILPGHADLFAFVVRVTIWSIPLIGMELVMGYGLNAAGKDAIQARLAAPAAALSLFGSVALVVAFGVQGACWSMVLRPAIRAAFLAPVALSTFWLPAAGSTVRPIWGSLRKAG